MHVPVKSVAIDSGVAGYAVDLIKESGLSGSALVVADENTNKVLGNKVANSLNAKILVLENGVKADINNLNIIKDAAKSVDYIVAVGGGTINDLCKYSSFLSDKPYVIFGTAPSMNGYGSANASITKDGHKKTLKAHLPQGIFLDLDVLSQAPLRLIRSGLGDSICRSTAQADWLLSHLLLGTYYTDIPFEILKSCEAELFANVEAIVNGDAEAMRLLAETLVLSGFGMYLAGGSYPASQGEHMIAHTMEMAFGDSLPNSYHGEQIGITTLTMAKLQEEILSCGKINILMHDAPESLRNFLGDEIASECISEYKVKKDRVGAVNSIEEKIHDYWGDVARQLSSVTVPYNHIYKALKTAGCHVSPEEIGWDEGDYLQSVKFAKYSRDRFTFLDFKN